VEEVEANEKLPGSLKVIKMTKFVAAYLGMPVFEYLNHRIKTYSYIVLPLCKKGTLLDLLMRVCEYKVTLSTGVQQYLSCKLVDSLIHLNYEYGLAHLDLKPDNVVICDDWSLSLIDFGHANNYRKPLCCKTGTP
jgi:serine/threonine protein kinase